MRVLSAYFEERRVASNARRNGSGGCRLGRRSMEGLSWPAGARRRLQRGGCRSRQRGDTMPAERWKPLSIDEMTPEQRRITGRVASDPRQQPAGADFRPMFRSPRGSRASESRSAHSSGFPVFIRSSRRGSRSWSPPAGRRRRSMVGAAAASRSPRTFAETIFSTIAADDARRGRARSRQLDLRRRDRRCLSGRGGVEPSPSVAGVKGLVSASRAWSS